MEEERTAMHSQRKEDEHAGEQIGNEYIRKEARKNRKRNDSR